MQADLAARVHLRGVQVGQVTAELNLAFGKASESMLGIANSMDREGGAVQGGSRRHEKLFQLSGALFVPPVPDPDRVRVLFGSPGEKVNGVCGFVKCPGVLHAKTFGVYAPDRVAEGENTIKFA